VRLCKQTKEVSEQDEKDEGYENEVKIERDRRSFRGVTRTGVEQNTKGMIPTSNPAVRGDEEKDTLKYSRISI